MKPLLERIDHTLIGLAWRQWNTLGVAGESSQDQDCFIDLESLILLTSVIGKSDPRLLEEALDWCSKFHHFVSISRLRTLIEELGSEVYLPFSTFAETLNSISKSKWPTFIKTSPLPISPSGKSQPPNCKIPALLGLRLRALFGVGARADLTTFFLIQKSKSFTAADSVEIGYNKRTLADALDSFVQSGLLTYSMIRNQKQYQLAKKEQLASLAGELPHIAPNWRIIIEVLVTLRVALSKCQNYSVSSTIVVIRNALACLKDHLYKLNISSPLLSADPADWESYIEQVNDVIKALVFRGDSREPSPTTNNFEQIFSSLIQNLYRVDDYIDGLDFIISCSMENSIKHQEIFKECYQMSACYLEELQSKLETLLKFPIYLLMDVKLSETMHKYSQEDLQSFLLFIKNVPPATEISLAGIALNWYKTLEIELDKIRRFIYELKNRLKDLYFYKTNIHLLTQSPILYKRHAVLKLFSIIESL